MINNLIKHKINTFTEVPLKKRKILIITTENRDDEYIKLHDINFDKYSKIHGYEYLRLDNCVKEESSIYWCKIHKVKQGLVSGKYDYVMWCDSDTIITDNQVSIDYFISKLGEPDIIFGNDHNGLHINIIHNINAGVFLIKNSEIGKSFIDDCLIEIANKPWCIKDGKEQGIWAGECYEQGVINNLIRTNKYKNKVCIDVEELFILNLSKLVENIPKIIKKPIEKLGFILHLPGQSLNDRVNYFRKFV